ncbi:MAG: hypothetical protein AAF366_11825 [Pseudomonadota bacterium]
MLGTWRFGDRKTLCYTYGQASFNSVTGQRSVAGQELCNRYYGDGGWVAKVPGDVFDLRSGRVPDFDLTRCVLPPPLLLLDTGQCRPRG